MLIYKNMFCKKCGSELSSNTKFCSNCGNSNILPSKESASVITIPKNPHRLKKTIGTIVTVVVFIVFMLIKFGATVDNEATEKNNIALESMLDWELSDTTIYQFEEAADEAVSDSAKMTIQTNIGYAYATQGENDLALKAFKEALQLAPQWTFDFHLISSEIAQLEWKPYIASNHLNDAYSIDPNSYQVNNALSLFYLDLEDKRPEYVDYPKALTHAIKAYEVAPEELVKQNLAIAYYYNDDYDKAIYLMSTSDYNNNPNIAFLLGMAYIWKEDIEKAKFYIDIAVAGWMAVPQEVINYFDEN